MVKYVLVTGGVISGIGKGIVASSTGLLLKSLGFHVTAIKIDPYLNVDAGTISPIDHGEVFVLEDGGEVDLDLGNYERFLDVKLRRDNNITTGKVYRDVIERERRGDFLGKTVQVVPHVTDAIQDWVERVSRRPTDSSGMEPDYCVVEMGGTVGDIENAPFIEAMRQFQFRVGHDNFCVIHVSLIPIVGSVGEQKSKPTQAGVRDLRSLGLNPDMVVCRCTQPIDTGVRDKISMFCHVTPDHVFSVPDCPSVYHVPLLLHQQGLLQVLLHRFKVPIPQQVTLPPLLSHWKSMCDRADRASQELHIAFVGKYTELKDSYISVMKSLYHASLACDRRLVIDWVEATDLDPQQEKANPTRFQDAWRNVQKAAGILVPGGFGERGLEGKIAAANYARTHKIPYLGICLGLQVAVIEFARHVLHWQDANSTEVNAETQHPVVVFMPEISKTHMGGTMRLGKRTSVFSAVHARTSMARRLYGNVDRVEERHRHRYEVNPEYVAEFEAKGMHFVAKDEDQQRMEIMELDRKLHPFYVGTQFHPEFMTRPLRPSKIFLGFVMAAARLLDDFFQDEFVPITEETILEKNGDSHNATPKKRKDEKSQLLHSKEEELMKSSENVPIGVE